MVTAAEQHTSATGERWVVRAFAALTLLFVGGVCFLEPRRECVDDMGLLNPIYEYVQSGRMTYPAYLQFDAMVVHPPLHYLVIAWLVQLGATYYYAIGMPFFLLTLLLVALTARSAFATPTKVALLFAPIATVSLYPPGYLALIRPDATLAMAWLAGLVALESARRDGWRAGRLLLGGSLLAFASGLHYYGATAAISIVIYAAWALIADWRGSGLRRAAAIVGGTALIAVPYAALFVLPHYHEIRSMIGAVQEARGPVASLQRHIGQYELLCSPDIVTQTGSAAMTIAAPALRLHVPAVLIGVGCLVLFRDTRWMALAAAPLPLFVLLGSPGKSLGYFAPEFLLYFFAVALVALAGFARLVGPRYRAGSLATVAAALAVATIATSPSAGRMALSPFPREDEAHLARAAMREILGDNALVGGRIGYWYASGASYWHNICPDIIWQKRLSDAELVDYFAQFTALAEYDHQADATYSDPPTTLTSCYANRELALRGFYFSTANPNLSCVLTSSASPAMLAGYICDDAQHISRFESDPDGDFVFAALLVGAGATLQPLLANAIASAYFPLPAGKDRSLREGVLLLLMPWSEDAAYRGRNGTSAAGDLPALPTERELHDVEQTRNGVVQVRDEIRLRRVVADRDALLAGLAARDRRIEYVRPAGDERGLTLAQAARRARQNSIPGSEDAPRGAANRAAASANRSIGQP